MAHVNRVSGKRYSLGAGAILLMLFSFLVSAFVSFGTVRAFFVIKADIKAQAVRQEEERENRELAKSPAQAEKQVDPADESWARSARDTAERKTRAAAEEKMIDDKHYEAFRRDMEHAGLNPDSQKESEIRTFNKILRDNGLW